VLARALQLELDAPAQQDLARRAVPEAAVDLRAAADTAALDVADRHAPQDRRHAATSIEQPHRLRGRPAIVGEPVARALFQHADLESRARQLERGDGAARTRADDHAASISHGRPLPPPPATARAIARRAPRRPRNRRAAPCCAADETNAASTRSSRTPTPP